jgi:hypothetical protein
VRADYVKIREQHAKKTGPEEHLRRESARERREDRLARGSPAAPAQPSA